MVKITIKIVIHFTFIMELSKVAYDSPQVFQGERGTKVYVLSQEGRVDQRRRCM